MYRDGTTTEHGRLEREQRTLRERRHPHPRHLRRPGLRTGATRRRRRDRHATVAGNIRHPRFTRQDYYLPPGFAAPRRFYATTGISVTRDGVDHSEDVSLAARNALLNMLDHLTERGWTPQEAYAICSVAVDLKISQVVDVPTCSCPPSCPKTSSPAADRAASPGATAESEGVHVMDLKLEVVVPVTDVDKAEHFCGTGLACRLDADASAGDAYRVVQMTPPGSPSSIIFGKGITSAQPGSLDSLVLVVDGIDAARDELLSRGVEVSEVFHDAGGGLAGGFQAGTEGRATGPDPQGRSYASYASFSDPDGNGWLLQEITERVPGRV